MNFDEFPDNDPHFEDITIAAVDPSESDGGGWGITLSSGWSFFVPPESQIPPETGMRCRMYGKGLGYRVRGLFLDGRRVFYRTATEEDAKHSAECLEREQERKYDFEKNRADYDRRYRALPVVFRERLDRFRTNNPEFRWEYEPYEMFTCEQAVVMADYFRSPSEGLETNDDLIARMNTFRALDWELQKAAMPGLSDGHSGNTFGCAMALAYQYLAAPRNVPKMHGAMSPVVGSVAYGDVPRDSNEIQ